MRGEPIWGNLVLVRMANATSVVSANGGAGRFPYLSRLARAVEEQDIHLSCTAVAPHNAGPDTGAVGALSRFGLRATGGAPYPDRGLRIRFRARAEAKYGRMDVDMVAHDDGGNARGSETCSPSRSAFEGPLPFGGP